MAKALLSLNRPVIPLTKQPQKFTVVKFQTKGVLKIQKWLFQEIIALTDKEKGYQQSKSEYTENH